MWINLFRAEWHKIIGNRWATGSMIWIFPGGAILFTLLLSLAAALSPDLREALSLEPARWTGVAISPWFIPNNPLGRFLLLGFTAVLFAGEYQWNTLKSIVPRTQRVALILVKFFAVGLFVVFAFTLMSILLTLGMGLVSLIAGIAYGPPLGSEVLSEFVEDYGLQMFFAFVTTIIAAGIAALAAMVTRSILGSVITGIVVTIGEGMLLIPLTALGLVLETDIYLNIYRFLPGYNLTNLFAWLFGETPVGIGMPSGEMIVDSQLFSGVVLVSWVIGSIALTAYLFNRQDITN